MIRTLNVPVAIVVPLMVPVEVFKLMPVGSDPVVSDQLYGGVPAAAARVAEYGTPAVASGSDDVVIVSAGMIVNDRVLVAVCGVLAPSLTCTVKLNAPLVDGVPLNTPAEFSSRPVGNAPVVTDQLYGKTPPVALNDCEYPAVEVPEGSVGELVIVSVGSPPDPELILIERAFDADTLATLSLTRIVKLKVPATDGVPEISPLFAFKVSPVGIEPVGIDQL